MVAWLRGFVAGLRGSVGWGGGDGLGGAVAVVVGEGLHVAGGGGLVDVLDGHDGGLVDGRAVGGLRGAVAADRLPAAVVDGGVLARVALVTGRPVVSHIVGTGLLVEGLGVVGGLLRRSIVGLLGRRAVVGLRGRGVRRLVVGRRRLVHRFALGRAVRVLVHRLVHGLGVRGAVGVRLGLVHRLGVRGAVGVLVDDGLVRGAVAVGVHHRLVGRAVAVDGLLRGGVDGLVLGRAVGGAVVRGAVARARSLVRHPDGPAAGGGAAQEEERRRGVHREEHDDGHLKVGK